MKKNKKGFTSALTISLAMHALLVAALLWGTDFTMDKPQNSGNMVQAVVIDPKLVQQQANEIRQKRDAAARAEQERLDKLRKQSEQLEKNRQAEEARIRKLKEDKAKADKAARDAEKARVKKEQERIAAAEKVRKEQERIAKAEAQRKEKEAAIAKAEAQRLAKEEAIKKAEAERVAKQAAIAKAEKERIEREKAAAAAAEKARREKEAAEKAERDRIAKEKAAAEAAEKARKEKERLERLERERKQQEAALNDIFSGLESEQAANSSAQQRFVADEVSRYGEIYKQLIKNKLRIDDSYRGKTCRVNIQLVHAGGEGIVRSANALDGDSRVCTATKSAITQVGSFPVPADSDVANKLKDINLTVELD
ncbi:cell envelope integrity protein TolA [Vibrio sp. SCSIO 43136]|uniref:cell envelope integrity protein TolA n=1 Tax=Vibrio sp. SCSIO 43136 TaxID=2819101 RepID=UPI0020759142|nr:cell envelope integrity protein TolA [Vibrio sp. SCSIO 43136]USD64322.1 cell envelope integrity protein TolA [Vibrio sp. SCSIO 43136]